MQIGKYMDDNIEEIVPLQFDYGVNDFFRIVLRRDHCDRPTALSLLTDHPAIKHGYDRTCTQP